MRADFNEELRAALSAQQMATSWQVAINESGAIVPFKHAGAPIYKAIHGYSTYFVPMTFRIGGMEVQVTFDQAGKVGGLYFRPPGFDSRV